jgi:D-hexose-6-phosphate mutarotase
VYLHGAHVTQFHPRHAKRPVLWMSGSSMFEPNKPIRGGVPICFPWFGPKKGVPDAPSHGYARLRDWHVDLFERTDEGVKLRLYLDDEGNGLETEFHLAIGKTLEMTLRVTNVSYAPAMFEEALHTYFRVSDVRNIEVHGLKGAEYLAKPNYEKKKEEADAIRFTEETDRVYLNTTATCTIVDPGMKRKIVVAKSGSKSTVVWNAFKDRAAQLKDLGESWPPYVCIETANVGPNSVALAPSHTHEMTARISVEPL